MAFQYVQFYQLGNALLLREQYNYTKTLINSLKNIVL